MLPSVRRPLPRHTAQRRLLLSAGSLADRWEDLVWPVFFLLLIWLILWWVSTRYAEGRSKKS